MKKLFIIICILVAGSTAAVVAQSDAHAIPYQAVARDASGNLLANQTISLRFSLITGSASGSLYYQETQTATTNALGLFSTHIFQAVSNNSTGAFDPTKWKVIAVLGAFIKVEMDPSGGSTYTDMGTTQMMSVPFALYSEMSGSSEGALVYISGWNALTNSPSLVSSVGTKGFYYVVSVAGPTSLNGINDWGTGDWAIFNGSEWQKVDNTDVVSGASSVAFAPNADITSTNVQDAIVEVRDDTDAKLSSKQNSLGFTAEDISNKVTSISGTSTNIQYPGAKLLFDQLALKEPTITGTGNTTDFWSGAKTFVTLNKAAVGLGNVDNTSDLDKPVSTLQAAADAVVLSTASSKVSRSGDTMTGNLILNADPTTTLGAATKQYVDAAQTSVNTKVSKAGDTMTGLLVLSADPSTALGAATKQYVDAGDASVQAQVSSKVNKAGDTMTGNLILNADPAAALGAATKQYVDAGDASVQTQVSSKVNKAGDTMTGNLILNADPAAALGAATKQYVDAADASLINSYIHRTDDGVTIYLAPGATHKRFGIGDTAPVYPLGIKGETGQDDQMISLTSSDASQKWNINLNPTGNDIDGFSIDDITSGTSSSRFFIDHVNQGNIGIGTVTPSQKLHIEESTSAGITGIKILNTATANNQGWKMGHLQDAVTARDGAFTIFEEPLGTGTALERITVLPSHNVGINETMPFATLHVSRPASDPQSEINLAENTGILLLGPIDNENLAMDAHQIQARTGEYIGSTLSFTATPLGLQPLGGDIVIHNSMAPDKTVTIDSDGKIGLGKTPVERLDVNGAVTFGDTQTATPAEGTVRWHVPPGSIGDLEVFRDGLWKSLTTQTTTDGFGPAGTGMITYNASNAKVGIGVTSPTCALTVLDNSSVTGASTGATITNTSSTSSSSSTDNRVGLALSNTGTWGGSSSSKNIGLYISNVTGQTNANSNIAAVLNGNTVIGDVTANSIVGTGGTNVLAIQTGAAPTAAPGSTSTGGIQIYSADISTGTVSPPVSVFNVMTGDGNVIKLYRSSAITAPDNSAVNSTYGANEQTIISNMRDRINQLETKLQALGLLD